MALAAFEPEVSVLVPCYNAERWIGPCLDSALAQDHPRFEVVVVDDGSTDNSLALLRSYGSRIRLESLDHRGGNAARNRLLELARGAWLQYLDADDYLLPGKLSRQTAAASGTDWDVVNSPVRLFYEATGDQRDVVIDPGADPALQFLQWAPFGTIGPLFRREALVRAGGWNEAQLCCQEHELFLRLISAGSRFGLVNTPLCVYRIHGSNSVSRKDPLRTVRERMRLSALMEARLRDTGALTEAHRAALAVARLETARSAYSRDPVFARELFQTVMAGGRRLWPRTPALPLRYQWAALVGGLDFAENLAARARGRFSSPESGQAA